MSNLEAFFPYRAHQTKSRGDDLNAGSGSLGLACPTTLNITKRAAKATSSSRSQLTDQIEAIKSKLDRLIAQVDDQKSSNAAKQLSEKSPPPSGTSFLDFIGITCVAIGMMSIGSAFLPNSGDRTDAMMALSAGTMVLIIGVSFHSLARLLRLVAEISWKLERPPG
jgi:hypothetical protein